MTADLIIGFLTLTLLEIVLGIDNLIFISILSNKLPVHQRSRARKTGIALALITRLMLLGSISWIVQLTTPLFTIGSLEFSGQSIILLGGGFFLLAKGTYEIHESLEGEPGHKSAKGGAVFGAVVAQIVALDIVFSLDSVITAVGMADDIEVMIAAVVIAVGVMLWASGPLARFVQEHPTVKILALSFLILIGFSLVAEGFHQHIPKGYIYTAMAFSVAVEMVNLRVRAQEDKRQPVPLKQSFAGERVVQRVGERRIVRD